MTLAAPKGVVFDIDGVLTYQGKVYPGAIEVIELLRRYEIPVRFSSNSTLKSRASCASKLRKTGFTVEDAEVVTASFATARYLEALKPRSCWIMLEGAGLDEFRELPQTTGHPEYLVIGDNRSCFTFDTLNRALRCLLKGSKLIGMTGELVDSSLGEVELNVGSWVGMLERASGRAAIYIGKPEAYMFNLALESMALPHHEVYMVGDRISTDIQGARRLGMRTVLLRSGEYARDRHLAATNHADLVFDSIAEFLEHLQAVLGQ